MSLQLREITDDNRAEVLALSVAPAPWMLWKLLVDARFQGRGYGRQIILRVADLVRANGGTELLTSYVPGEDGPAGFYARLGFTLTGETDEDGEVYARLVL